MPSVKITECRSDLICPKYQIAQIDPKEATGGKFVNFEHWFQIPALLLSS